MLGGSACHLAVQVPKVGRHSLLSPLFARLVIRPHVLQLYEEGMKASNIVKLVWGIVGNPFSTLTFVFAFPSCLGSAAKCANWRK